MGGWSVGNKANKGDFVRGDLSPLQDLNELEAQWIDLQGRSECSFFMSWAWIRPWVEAVASDCQLYIYRCRHGERLVGLGILCESAAKKRGILPYREFSLNECRQWDCNFWVEYNGLLTERSYTKKCWQNLFVVLSETDLVWHEIALSAVDAGVPEYCASAMDSTVDVLVEAKGEPWYVDLAEKDASMDQLLRKFSKNRRWQIRRSLKEYQCEGAVELVEAKDVEEALDYFKSMGELHTARWNSVGEAGVFSNPRWVNFHRSLIRGAFDTGAIQMLRLSSGMKSIGYIYNFVWRDEVCVLQTGFVLEEDNVRKPGYLAHCMAMVVNAGRHIKRYDFLAGESQYKKSLAKAGHPMLWIKVRKKLIRFRLLALLEGLYRFFRGKFGRKPGKGRGWTEHPTTQ